LRPADGPVDPRLVLLVEDDPDIRADTRERLCAIGHNVIEAASAEDARALARLDGLGVVLSDINLAGAETGLDLLEGLRADLPGVAMGLMTSLPPGDALHARAARAFPVLRKPFETTGLRAFLARCDAAVARTAAE